MRQLVTLAYMFTAACAHGPPAVVIKTVEVRVPVPVACVAPAAIPAMPAPVGDRLTGDAVGDLDLVAQSAIALRVALDKALALLTGCVQP